MHWKHPSAYLITIKMSLILLPSIVLNKVLEMKPNVLRLTDRKTCYLHVFVFLKSHVSQGSTILAFVMYYV